MTEIESANERLAREVVHGFARTRGNLLASMYEGYRQNVIPRNAPIVQVIECKRAFFAGAQTILDLMAMVTDPGPEVTVDDEAFMKALGDELYAYTQEGQLREHIAAVPPEGRA